MCDDDMIKVSEFLSAKDIDDALNIVVSETDIIKTVTRITDEVITPIMDRINKFTNQENDPKTVAYTIYCLLWAASQKFDVDLKN